MNLLNKNRAGLLLTHFREAIKNNEEVESIKIINRADEEGYHLIAGVMRDEYQSFYGTSDDFDANLDLYVQWQYAR